MNHIKKCNPCGIYTLKDKCPSCGNMTLEPRPPKFSVKDKFASYRREAKERERKKQGLL